MGFIPPRSAETVHGREHITNMLNGHDDVVRLSLLVQASSIHHRTTIDSFNIDANRSWPIILRSDDSRPFEILNARYEQGNTRMRFEALEEGSMRLNLQKANHLKERIRTRLLPPVEEAIENLQGSSLRLSANHVSPSHLITALHLEDSTLVASDCHSAPKSISGL